MYSVAYGWHDALFQAVACVRDAIRRPSVVENPHESSNPALGQISLVYESQHLVHYGATLGTMLGELRTARHKFDTALSTMPGRDPLAPIEEAMRALWEGQTSRHGAQTGTVPETLEAARAGVHLAVMVVQWFVSGAVTRKP